MVAHAKLDASRIKLEQPDEDQLSGADELLYSIGEV